MSLYESTVYPITADLAKREGCTQALICGQWKENIKKVYSYKTYYTT